ncbi:biotin carboxylase N-terminal domain-containing protein [Neotabrizicola sp. VNH66]|uniref:ATP-binding protein n=1 Tax=Neotabrizicola sp. VNH66 TaxID=3400918 RepID=UPI003BFCC944
MFRKILIANRGEIACRVIATARRMGIATVAVFSDADRNARHVAMADEAVHIGGATVAESYLQGSRIIAAAQATGAEAIHPGYGFLSENPGFVEAVAAAGLAFIGPTADAIRAMGLKDAAKALMEGAGVPVVPGYYGAEQGMDFLAARAAEIGWPVLIKARAGGGGKGMRLVERAEDFAEALASAQREAQAAFGDPACLIEKYVTRPRHIEIQVFGDAHGNVIHLFERDCSLQRRHQKVIEEAPAPGMTPEMRAAMGAAAVEAARAIGYRGAGTVEFIVDGSGPLRPDGFWFMEMNTRLQVEHPVSEAITGLDFVELQLRVAAGEPLPVAQEDLRIDGWAFEARLYAEDAENGFLPATGRLDLLAFPPAAEFSRAALRIDSGVRQGDEISPFYDPMIAKVIVHGPTRAIALSRLSAALGQCRVQGSITNLGFLSALAGHDGFRRGEVDTGLIARDLTALLTRPAVGPHVAAAAVLSALGFLAAPVPDDPWRGLAGWRHWPVDSLPLTLTHGTQETRWRVTPQAAGRFLIAGGAAELEVTVAARDGETIVLELAGHRKRLEVITTSRRITICDDSGCHSFDLSDPERAEDAGEGGDGITAPMPGLVTRLAAKAGQQVRKGEALIVLEAMKMEHTLTAPRDGVVAEVLAAQGDQVAHGALLLMLEAADD